jgi:hypothetical protein
LVPITRIVTFLIIFVTLFILPGCNIEDEPQGLGGNMHSPCGGIAIIAKSKADCNTKIVFKDYINEFTFTGIQSAYYKLGPVCKQNMLFIKFFNSVHDHNEPNYEFGFYLPQFSNDEFFKIDTFQIDTIHYGESRLTGSHSKPIYDANVIFIWDEVSLNDSIYYGKGKFIINKKIPVNYPATYFFPEQEISFELCKP